MEVIIIREECHGVIGVATTDKAAKQWLIREGWVNKHNEVCNPYSGRSSSLEKLFGENWKKAYMNFDEEDMEYMGFYLNSKELIEETDCDESVYEDEDEEDE